MSLSCNIVQYLKLTDDVVVVFAPGDVQHGALVPGHQRVVRGHAAKLKYVISTLTLLTNVFTLVSGMTRKAPPPPDSTMQAINLGLTQQNVESHEARVILMLS